MGPALTLANTPLDLQITICILLHPSDILSLRKTCKALELATRKRIVWVAALHQVCLENTLFLPSFPIPDMSDLELERAAMAPRRWIKLCGEFQKQHSHDIREMLRPRTTRIIRHTTELVFIVPGGRYLVTAGNGIFVWDLGYVSTVDCKLVASGGLGNLSELCMVQATPDGKGLIILSSYISGRLSIFEIYPQSEIPLLTQIAHLDRFSPEEKPAHLLPDTLIFRVFHEDRIVFRVVDYRTNYSTCFSADVAVKEIDLVETFATKTAIIVFCEEGILIWAIPPLSPQSSEPRDHTFDNKPTHTRPLFKIPFPDVIVCHFHKIIQWMTVSSWYFGSWESVYFDILYKDSKLQRFKIIIKLDLSDAFLHVLNVSEIISKNFISFFTRYSPPCEGYRICEDALVYFWNKSIKVRDQGDHTGFTLTSAPLTNFVTRNHYIDSLCPTSGRYVYFDYDDDGNRRIAVDDLF